MTGVRYWLLTLALLSLCACASRGAPSLYQQLGGQHGVERAVDAMLVEIKSDPRIAHLFNETDFDYLRDRLVEQVCVVADGPCEYTGLSMEDAHSGMDISRSEFNWFVEDAERGLVNAGLPLPVRNRLLARMARMHGEIVGQ